MQISNMQAIWYMSPPRGLDPQVENCLLKRTPIPNHVLLEETSASYGTCAKVLSVVFAQQEMLLGSPGPWLLYTYL